MAEIVKNIIDVRNKGTINVYAVCYKQRGKSENAAVALPGNLNFELRSNFCENVIRYKDAQERAFNPTSDGLENNTYEYIPLKNVQKNWNEITKLFDDADNYCDNKSKQKVSRSNLFVCALDYNNFRYYFCAKQGNNSDKLLKGKHIFMSQQEELKELSSDKIFLLSCYVGFLIDTNEKKVLIFDKKMFQDIFRYDDYQRESVKSKISIIDKWEFLDSVKLIKTKCSQKNVYRNLAKIFSDEEYMEQIQRTTPAQLKNNLLTNSPENFTENDFEGDKLMVTSKNLDTVMKMLAKGFKFNFFTNSAEEL